MADTGKNTYIIELEVIKDYECVRMSALLKLVCLIIFLNSLKVFRQM